MPLPTGPAVTFLFTDIEGSTQLERSAGSDEWARLVARHDERLREAIESNGGVVVKTEGDAFFAAFASPSGAARAAIDGQRAIAATDWPATGRVRVRMGLHTGEGRLRGGRAPGDAEDYVGIDVNYTARIAAAGNGGQIVLSNALVEALTAAGEEAPLGEGVDLVDAGLRAVKDFDEPQRLHRLVVAGAADDDRPLRTLDAPTNLPGEMTTLVGRREELDQVDRHLRDARVVTLTGPGGSGKTRLALAVAGAARDRFPHGTWFVDLASVRDAGLLEPTIADALGVRETAEQPAAELVREHLRARTVLLVLDNLEQLLPRAAEGVSNLARVAPDVRLLVTSRELLRISGERGYTVPPLDADAGVELFEARAMAIRPDLALGGATRDVVRQLCARLGGIPLAIELAAARVRLMSPALLLERLAGSLDLAGSARDVPERQRTLRGAIAWSHDLLSEPERRLFRRLAAFSGGWTAEAAQDVIDADGDLGIHVLEGLESLADKSLVRIEPAGTGGSEEARFDFHPLLREYARERLDESGEAPAIEARHAQAALHVAERLGGEILDPSGARAIGQLDREVHNLRGAIVWAITHHEPEVALRIVAATWRWYQQRGLLREARGVLRQVLPPTTDPRLRIAGLAAEGSLAYWVHDVEAAAAAYGERLELAQGLGDPLLLAEAHYDIGFLSVLANEPEELRRHEEEAVRLFESTGFENGLLRARQALSLGIFLSGEHERARDVETENLELFRSKGSPWQVADTKTFLSAATYRLGEFDASWRWMSEALEFFAEHDNASGLARVLGMAAILLLSTGQDELGARVTGATYELVREKGVMVAPVTVLHLPDPRELASSRFGPGRLTELLADGAATPLASIVEAVRGVPPPAATDRDLAAT